MRTSLLAFSVTLSTLTGAAFGQEQPGLWRAYDDIFKGAKYIDLTHAFEPNQAV